MADPATRYSLMPIPPIAEHTRLFEVGAVTIGVEYRLLNNEIVERNQERQNKKLPDRGEIDDRGVSLHVYANQAGGEREERLRFDCFDEGPHYHYVNWAEGANDIVKLDTIADGDSLAWSLERIRTRLPQMLARAGADDVAAKVDPNAIEAIMPQVSEAAYRARFDHDEASILEGALG